MDDAIGEAFDKTAKMLGLPYPGGPAVEAAARGGDPTRFALPRPMLGRPNADFSLSGLKTATRMAAESVAPLRAQRRRRSLRLVPGGGRRRGRGSPARRLAAVSAAVRRAARAWSSPAASPPTARSATRWRDFAPRPACRSSRRRRSLCTDNGAMIAWAGIERLRRGLVDDLSAPARPRWPLDPKVEKSLNGKA